MLKDAVVNYMIHGIRNTFKVEGMFLKEKMVAEDKVKLKFDRLGFKITVEFDNKKISEIIYENFLSEYDRNCFMMWEFEERFKEYTEICNTLEPGEIEKMVERIVTDIKNGKLFDKNGNTIIREIEYKQSDNTQRVQETMVEHGELD